MRIGVPEEYRVDGMPPEIEKLWAQGVEWARDAGAEIKTISLKHTKYALPTYYIVAPGGSLLQPRTLRRHALWRAGAGEGFDRFI